jgi:hypothetical protein
VVGPGEEAAEGGGHTPGVAAKLPAADAAASSIAEEKSDVVGRTWYLTRNNVETDKSMHVFL